MLVIRHAYIERRMVPLNIYLQDATPAQIAQVVVEYGNAIKDLVRANIFPGDMLWKNFGVTRLGKVVFYDYDEIENLVDCSFRRIPTPRNEEEEMSGEVWYRVGPKDVFPETFGPFLLGNPAVREVFMKHHADLLDAAFWQGHKERIMAGYVHDVFPYEAQKRFEARRAAPAAADSRCRPRIRRTATHPLTVPPRSTAMADAIVIVSAARTPIGGLLGDFSSLAAYSSARARSGPPSSAPASPAMPSTRCCWATA
jgi:hypothetical protein